MIDHRQNNNELVGYNSASDAPAQLDRAVQTLAPTSNLGVVYSQTNTLRNIRRNLGGCFTSHARFEARKVETDAPRTR
jgi:hypothetical protein